jgi:hypothetical protein
MIVADPYGSAERRVAAAFVLAVESGAESARVVRGAIEQSADPLLRMALDRAARQEIDEAALRGIAAREEA